MTNPDAEWVGPSAETRFWFERSAAERKSPATELYGVVNHRLKETEVDGEIRVSLPVKPYVIADRSLTVPHGSYKTQ